MLKLLFTIAVVVAVWFVLKGRSRTTDGTAHRLGKAFGAARRAFDESAQARHEPKPVAEPEPKTGVPVELKPCPRCGTYIAEGQKCSCTP